LASARFSPALTRGIGQPPGGTLRRLSIRTLMAFVLVSTVGLAALRNANEWLEEPQKSP
jgi:hypothetical protein